VGGERVCRWEAEAGGAERNTESELGGSVAREEEVN